MLLMLLELVALGILLVISVTQIVIPYFRGTQIFPFFTRERVLGAKLEEFNQKEVEKRLAEKIKSEEKGSTTKTDSNSNQKPEKGDSNDEPESV